MKILCVVNKVNVLMEYVIVMKHILVNNVKLQQKIVARYFVIIMVNVIMYMNKMNKYNKNN